jgi:hypothetical protein
MELDQNNGNAMETRGGKMSWGKDAQSPQFPLGKCAQILAIVYFTFYAEFLSRATYSSN